MNNANVPNAGNVRRFPSDNRVHLALVAAGQIEKLATGIMVQIEDAGYSPAQPILNVVAVRLHDLAGAILGALGDEVHDYEDLAEVVNHGQTIIAPETDDDGMGASNG